MSADFGYRRGDVASSVVTPAPGAASSGRSREDNMRIFSTLCIILGAIGTQPALAEPSASGLAPRTEIHAIETITLSDQQLLTGDKNGQRVTIAGQLRFPGMRQVGCLPSSCCMAREG
jgi:hypothetical protein